MQKKNELRVHHWLTAKASSIRFLAKTPEPFTNTTFDEFTRKTQMKRIQMPIFSGGQRFVLEVDEKTASVIGSYHNAIRNLLYTNKLEALAEFVGRYVTDISGNRYLLETRPNVLYDLTTAEPDVMDQVYRILH